MRTEQLITNLTRDVLPVQPLGRPWRRTLVWAVSASLYLALLIVAMSPRDDLGLRVAEPRFMLEQLAALLTGLTAAAAACATAIPGYRRDVVVVPLVCLALWIAIVGVGAMQDARAGAMVFGGDWQCIATVLAGAALPAAMMAVMMRRGAPVRPRVTAALGMLAAAGLGNLGACLFHPHSSNLIVLVWHCGVVLGLAVAAGLCGRVLLPWPGGGGHGSAGRYSMRSGRA
jgi:hypothetical protein